VEGAARRTLIAYLPARAVRGGRTATATNYAAHQSLRPPYMHRSATDPSDKLVRTTRTFPRRHKTARTAIGAIRWAFDWGEPFGCALRAATHSSATTEFFFR